MKMAISTTTAATVSRARGRTRGSSLFASQPAATTDRVAASTADTTGGSRSIPSHRPRSAIAWCTASSSGVAPAGGARRTTIVPCSVASTASTARSQANAAITGRSGRARSSPISSRVAAADPAGPTPAGAAARRTQM